METPSPAPTCAPWARRPAIPIALLVRHAGCQCQAPSEVAMGAGTSSSRHDRLTGSSEPTSYFEPYQGNDGAENDHCPTVLITPSPVIFRHVLEIHAIDTGQKCRRDADD